MSITWAEPYPEDLEEKPLATEEIIALYQKAFSLLNRKFFNGILPEIMIDYFENGYKEMAVYNSMYNGVACFVTDTQQPFIIMGFDTFPEFGLCQEDIQNLFHEMVHYYCYLQKMEDVTVDGFHTLIFKKVTEEHGGSCSYVNEKIGFSDTKIPIETVIDILCKI